MSNTINRQTRRALKITGAMIDHAVEILLEADANGGEYTHADEDGYSLVCIDCTLKCLQAGWTRKRQPDGREQWEALASLAFAFINHQRELEEVEAH